MPCYSPLKGYRDAVTGGMCFDRQLDSQGNSLASEEMEVPCGQCLGCRLDRSRMWTSRICHEAQLYEFGRGNAFVTLTYDDEHLPSDWSLRKKDFQDFMKRLRAFFMEGRSTERDEFGRLIDPIRFYHCGEYGYVCKHRKPVSECDFCNVGRPHYHAILFNMHFDDQKAVGKRGDYTIYESERLNERWGMGFCELGSMTSDSAGYIAKYCLKKVNGINAFEHYESWDTATGEVTWLEPEYSTMSRNPGIGRAWFEKYWADVFEGDEVPIPGKGMSRGVPRYYEDLMTAPFKVNLEGWEFEVENRAGIEAIERVKAKRIIFRDGHAEDFTADRLIDKYICKVAQISTLKRQL